MGCRPLGEQNTAVDKSTFKAAEVLVGSYSQKDVKRNKSGNRSDALCGVAGARREALPFAAHTRARSGKIMRSVRPAASASASVGLSVFERRRLF